MVFPSLIVRRSAPIGEWWLPVLGVRLTGCGVGLLIASAGELVAPTHPADSAVRSTGAVETIASRVTPPAPAVGEASSGRGEVALATPKRSRRPDDRLGPDLATGRRAELAHPPQRERRTAGPASPHGHPDQLATRLSA